MAEIRDYDVTAANNNSSPPNGSPEGQLPSTINDTIREVMARLKREWSDRSGVNTTAGTSNAYTLAASQTITAYAAGDVFMFIADRANTGAATLAVDGLAAKSLVSNAQTALVANQIVANGIYVAAYDATNDTFQVMGVTDTGGALTLTSLSTDTINEATAAAGVTVDGVLLKDGGAVFADGASIEIDTVNEATAAAGVTVDGVLLKDGGAVFADGASVEVDTVNEATADAGVTADGVLLKDGGVTATAASSITASSGTALTVTNTGSGDSFLVEDSTNPDSSPVLVDNSGYFVVAHTESLAGTGSAKALIQAHTLTASNYWGGLSATNWSAGSYGGHLTLSNSRSGAKGTHTIVVDDDVLGAVHFAGSDGTQFHAAATVVARADGTPGTNDMPGMLAFSTTAAGNAVPTERMRIDSDGNVGIGVTPTAKLHVTNTGSDDSFLVEDSANPDSTPFVITSNGTLGLGTTAPSISNGVGPIIVSESSAAYGPQSSWRNTASDATAGYFHFEKSRSGGLVSASDIVGTISWRAHDGVDFRGVAGISAKMGDTPAAGDTPGILYFTTTAEGATSSTERMRIDSSGNVGVGVTAPDGRIHALSGSAGTVTASGDANELVVENNSSCGISLLAPDAQNTNIFFGSPTDSVGAYLRWNHDSDLFKVATDKTGAELAFHTGANAERMRIQAGGEINILNDVKIGGAAGDPPNARLDVVDDLGVTAAAHLVAQVKRSTGNFRGLNFGYIADGANDTDGYIASNGNTALRLGHNANINTTAPTLYLSGGGLCGIGTTAPTELLDVNSDAIRVRTSQTPASASATGDAGQICWDANYIYVCTATNTWKRSALATW